MYNFILKDFKLLRGKSHENLVARFLITPGFSFSSCLFEIQGRIKGDFPYFHIILKSSVSLFESENKLAMYTTSFTIRLSKTRPFREGDLSAPVKHG